MTAQQLKNAILQEAIQGRLVPQDPNDEPASVLLDRIRKEKQQLVKEGKLKKKDLEEKPISEDEIPFEIPESWEWCKLGWIGTWGAGATPAKGNSEFYNKGTIPWLRTGELNNSFVYDSEIKVTEKALEKCSLRMCQKGDVLIAMYGATIGKVAIAGIELTTNQACCACTPYIIYNRYLLYYLLACKKTFTEMGEGGAQPNISREKIIAFPFALPPLAEQHRIVAKIEELMPKVEEYGKAQEKLNKLNEELPERLKKSILQEAIEGRLVKQDPNDEPASALLAKIREEKKRLVKEGKLKKKDLEEKPISEDKIPFEIPESWEWCKLGSIATLIGGFAFKSNEYTSTGSRVIRISDITEEGFINKNVVRYPYNERLKPYVINRGDILMAMTGGTVGKSLYVRTLPEESMLLNQRVANIRVNTVLTDYIDYVIKSQHIQNIITDAKNSTNDNISMADIYSFPIPLPPLAEQHRIVAKIEQLLKQIDKL